MRIKIKALLLATCFGIFACADSSSLKLKGVASEAHNNTTEQDCKADARSITLINAIQGVGNASPLVGECVLVEATVTLVAPGLEGFFLQEQAQDFDADANTSEGIFVFTGDAKIMVSAGDLVHVTGFVSESFNRTQLVLTGEPKHVGTAKIEKQVLSLPVEQLENFEALEGMAIELKGPLTVVNTYNYTRFGEVEVANGRPFTPSHLYPAGSEEFLKVSSENARNKLHQRSRLLCR